MKTGRLLAASCTTGWADWVHGQLWLFDDGILRVSLGWVKSIEHGAALSAGGQRTTVPGAAAEREFTDSEISELAAADKRNHWIPASAIASASLRVGLANSRLALRLHDGTKIKLLWLKQDKAAEPLRHALEGWGVSA